MPLTPDQEKLVLLVVQESSEVIKEYTKGCLFGFDETHTDGTTALGRLKIEIADLVIVLTRLIMDESFISLEAGEVFAKKKLQRLLRNYPGLFDEMAAESGITREDEEARDGSD